LLFKLLEGVDLDQNLRQRSLFDARNHHSTPCRWLLRRSGTAATHDEDTGLAIACSLGAVTLKARVAAIEDLARRSLRTSRREPLKLHLTFAPEALPELRDLVAKETDCCAFLDFDLRAEPARCD